MPVAKEYYASALGNGFPFCLEETTLADLIADVGLLLALDNLTLEQAHYEYWNLQTLPLNVSYTLGLEETPPGGVDFDLQARNNTITETQPSSRVCDLDFFAPEQSGSGAYTYDIRDITFYPRVYRDTANSTAGNDRYIFAIEDTFILVGPGGVIFLVPDPAGTHSLVLNSGTVKFNSVDSGDAIFGTPIYYNF